MNEVEVLSSRAEAEKRQRRLAGYMEAMRKNKEEEDAGERGETGGKSGEEQKNS